MDKWGRIANHHNSWITDSESSWNVHNYEQLYILWIILIHDTSWQAEIFMQGASKIWALATWESSEKVQLETFEQCFTWLENHPSSSMTIPHFSLRRWYFPASLEDRGYIWVYDVHVFAHFNNWMVRMVGSCWISRILLGSALKNAALLGLYRDGRKLALPSIAGASHRISSQLRSPAILVWYGEHVFLYVFVPFDRKLDYSASTHPFHGIQHVQCNQTRRIFHD